MRWPVRDADVASSNLPHPTTSGQAVGGGAGNLPTLSFAAFAQRLGGEGEPALPAAPRTGASDLLASRRGQEGVRVDASTRLVYVCRDERVEVGLGIGAEGLDGGFSQRWCGRLPRMSRNWLARSALLRSRVASSS